MSKISAFVFVSADGFFAGPNGEIDWFKSIAPDDEYREFTSAGSKAGNTLMFGHTTYEMMKSYWPTPDAMKSDPGMAEVMNKSPKIVFSKSLKSVEEGPDWKNIRLIHDLNKSEIMKLKEEADGDITILGSGSIVQQLTNLGLIDEFRLVVVPVILGEGKSLFKDVKETNLKLVEERSFKNGIISPLYQPA